MALFSGIVGSVVGQFIKRAFDALLSYFKQKRHEDAIAGRAHSENEAAHAEAALKEQQRIKDAENAFDKLDDAQRAELFKRYEKTKTKSN